MRPARYFSIIQLSNARVREGREEGVAMIILNMLKSGMSVSDIKKYTGVGESMIVQVQKSMGTLIHKS